MSDGREIHGRQYWCVRTPISRNGKIYLRADEAHVLSDGTLVLLRLEGESKSINLAIAPGRWIAFFRANADGSPEAVDQWPGAVDVA